MVLGLLLLAAGCIYVLAGGSRRGSRLLLVLRSQHWCIAGIGLRLSWLGLECGFAER